VLTVQVRSRDVAEIESWILSTW